MFGIGGGDEKDRLEENMEEIKDLIEENGGNVDDMDQQSEEPQSGGDNFSGVSGQQTSGFQNTAGQNNSEQTTSFDQLDQGNDNTADMAQDVGDSDGEGVGNFNEEFSDNSDTGSFNAQQPSEEGDNLEKTQDISTQDQSGQLQNEEGLGGQLDENVEGNQMDQTFDQQPVNQSNQQPQAAGAQTENPMSQGTSVSQSTPEDDRSRDERSRLNEQIPEPPETKKLDVPEIDKGPLFIKRQKFESAQRMIQEMKQISHEIDQVVNQLQKGIEQDRETARNAKELLHELEEDRRGVKQIVSPEEN